MHAGALGLPICSCTVTCNVTRPPHKPDPHYLTPVSPSTHLILVVQQQHLLVGLREDALHLVVNLLTPAGIPRHPANPIARPRRRRAASGHARLRLLRLLRGLAAGATAGALLQGRRFKLVQQGSIHLILPAALGALQP